MARRVEDKISRSRAAAIAFLKPYSMLEADKSRGPDIEWKVTVKIPPFAEADAKTNTRLSLPILFKRRLNDHVPFGSVRKTFRGMWMASESHKNLSEKLHTVWTTS